MAGDKQNRDGVIMHLLLDGRSDIRSSAINIEDGYLAREMRENLEFQGFDPFHFGFRDRERTYSAYEASVHKANRDMEEHESARVDYDPLEEQNIDREALKEENMEDKKEVVMKNIDYVFVSLVKMDLVKAKIHISHGQAYPNGTFAREWFRIEVTNNDLEERRIFRISAKEPFEITTPTGEIIKPRHTDVKEIESGTFELERFNYGRSIKMTINGKSRIVTVNTNISMTEEVEKKPVVSNDPWDSL